MAGLDELLGSAARGADGGIRYAVGADWLQGRTVYGGLTAALALDAVLAAHPAAAPLRSAQISFVGPVGGDCHVATRLLRHSKSSLFAAADVTSANGFGTSAVFSFMPARASAVDHASVPRPAIAAPDALAPVPPHPLRPAFSQQFEMRPAHGPAFLLGQDDGTILTWVRWVDRPTCAVPVALLALADALPPAALPLFPTFGPISSSTWMQHFLVDQPASASGWWLLSSSTRQVQRGFSVQDMAIWNDVGELVSLGAQGVAVYV